MSEQMDTFRRHLTKAAVVDSDLSQSNWVWSGRKTTTAHTWSGPKASVCVCVGLCVCVPPKCSYYSCTRTTVPQVQDHKYSSFS